MKPPRVLCFGEVLWDCLPSGRLPGGAPLNVAYHLARLGADAVMLSAVGDDALGAEMLAYLAGRGLNTEFVAKHPSLPTGTVSVVLSEAGQPSYTIEQDVAWDDLAQGEGWRQAVEGARALVFGSLAARSPANRQALDELLSTHGLLRIMDVNLRTPYDDRDHVLALARRADWLKLNEHELAALTGRTFESGDDADSLVPTMKILGDLIGSHRMCVTRVNVVPCFGTMGPSTPPKLRLSWSPIPSEQATLSPPRSSTAY